MNHRHLRPAPTPSRSVTPFHRGPSAQPIATAPTGSAHGAPQNAPNAAMLIDFDNVTMGIRSDLQGELKNLLSSDIIKGKVAVRRAYADWRRYPQYIVPLTESSIDLIFAPAYGSAKKNATDIRLAIDAMELVFTRPEIGTFVLLSGDSDFSSMVIKLKEYGKYVIGVGIRESSSDLLVMNCDEYYSYNALAGLVKSGDDESTRWDPDALVTEAITRMKRNGDVMRSDRLKQVMQEIDSSFDEKNLGHPKFSRFVQDASHKGLLRSTKLDNGQLEVDVALGGSTPAGASSTPSATPVDASGDVSVTDEHAVATDARRERPDRERDDRRGRRGRRGRGREREPREGEAHEGEVLDGGSHDGEDTGSGADKTILLNAGEGPATFTPPAPAVPAFTPPYTQTFRPAVTAPAAVEAPVAAAPAAQPFGDPVSDSIGRGGERLTRIEAFDLVRRAVEALVTGEETTSASAVRQRAFEILGRDSESLSARNFERILRDSHDADMIDLRRRGNDFEVARAVDAAPIVEQLKNAEQAHKAAAAANAPPPPPRGMSHRGVGSRNKSGRASAPIDPSMLMMGVVGGTAKAAPAAAPVEAATAKPQPVVAKSQQPAVAEPVAPTVKADAPAAAAPSRGAGRRGGRAPAPTVAPVTPPAVAAPVNAPVAKAPAKKAAKSARPAAKQPARPAEKAVEAKPAAKKAGRPPAKKAAKSARK
jgi:uncharacterized protein (TIGR00288 family)